MVGKHSISLGTYIYGVLSIKRVFQAFPPLLLR
jgi:hypothetical protein